MSENKPQDEANPVGAPSKYQEDIPEKLLAYFSENRTFVLMDKEYPAFNSVEGFCASIQIAKSTFYAWVKKYPLLSNALGTAKQYQADQLYQYGANRIFDPSYAKLLTINCTDMVDKKETDLGVTKEVKKLIIDMD